jgi:hypothetical protein
LSRNNGDDTANSDGVVESNSELLLRLLQGAVETPSKTNGLASSLLLAGGVGRIGDSLSRNFSNPIRGLETPSVTEAHLALLLAQRLGQKNPGSCGIGSANDASNLTNNFLLQSLGLSTQHNVVPQLLNMLQTQRSGVNPTQLNLNPFLPPVVDNNDVLNTTHQNRLISLLAAKQAGQDVFGNVSRDANRFLSGSVTGQTRTDDRLIRLFYESHQQRVQHQQGNSLQMAQALFGRPEQF